MPAAANADDNLTRAEARDRATKLSGVSYTVALDLTAGEETFTSDTTIRFQGNLHGISAFVDLDAVSLREATLNGRTIPVDSYDRSRSRIPLRGLRANNELRVVADCAYQHTGVGMHRFADPTDGKVYLHTQFEPYDAHRVFACFDQPDIKASFTLSVTAPPEWTVIANSPSTREDQGPSGPASGGSRVWRFSSTPVISSYLVAVVAGPYHEVRETYGQIDLGIFCRESLAEHLDADELFTLTRQGLDFFEEEFGYPYPFAKYDQLFVPEFNFGAMENPGCVTFNEYMVFRARQTDASYEGRANTLLHEMAHMWFGDLVTMRWWDDLWLNESFATYMATHALARATRFSDSWVRFAAGTKGGAMAQDQLPTTHPISADIVDTDAVRLHFDGITYLKGASVLKQLVAWVGQDAFVEGLRRYFRRHEWGNAELADLLSVLEKTSGRKLAPWSEEWLETAGVNTLRADFAGTATFDTLAIVQEGQPGNTTLRSHRVAVGLYRLGDGGLVRDRRVELDVIGERTEVAELAGAKVPDLLLLNDDDLTYAKIRLDERSLATLADHLGDIVDPLARNLCWAATWDMVRDAELPTRRYLALVLAHAPGETDDSTLQRLLGQASTAVEVYGDPARRASGRAALAAAARAGLEASEPGTDRQLVWARHLFSVVEAADDVGFALGVLDGSVDIPGLAVDTDLRWHIVMALASRGTDVARALIESELERDPTDIGERRAAWSRSSRPTAEAKAAAWSRLNEEAGLPLATLRSIAGGFHHTGQDEVLAPYVQVYFDALGGFWADRSRDEALSLARGLYPGALVGQVVLDATDRALADDALPGPFRRILLEGKDGMERAMRGRAADAG